ncbi:MAG: alpha-galactosidase [Acidobacteria bacterium]|nr:alpha-galactosidase [Acidobacteriota bacterium]
MGCRLLVVVGILFAATSAVSDPILASSWTLENDRISVVYGLDPDGAFRLASFQDKRSGKHWSASPNTVADLINVGTRNFKLDSRTAYSFVTASQSDIEKEGKRLTIVLRPLGVPAEVTFEAEVYSQHPFVRQRYRLKNLGSRDWVASSASFLKASFQDDNHVFRSFHVNQWVDGGRQGNFETFETDLAQLAAPLVVASGSYAQHCSWLALLDARNAGLAIGWEFNGRAQMVVSHDFDKDSVNLEGSISALNQRIEPGQVFELPAVFIGAFTGDWDEAAYRTQSFVEAVLSSALPDRRDFPYVIWDSWGYQLDIDEVSLRRAADIAARLGVEVFTIDLGWAKMIGDWSADPIKFPSGMRALSDYVHARGMKFGLHFPLTQADPNSPILRRNPNWSAFPRAREGFFDAVALCPAHEPAKQWIIAEALRLIQEYNVDWILQDGVNMVPECTRTNHTHEPGNGNYANAVHGIDEIVAAIRARSPQTAWENCESGGRMMTYQMVRHYATSIASDDSDELITRQAVYGATFPFPPRFTDRYMPLETVSKFFLRSGMIGGGPLILMSRLDEWSEDDIALAASEMKLYKSVRRLIRDGRAFHLTPRPDGQRTEVHQSYNRRMDRAVIFVFRNSSPESRQTVIARGLQPGSEYRVQLEEAGTTVFASGRELMESGIEVPLPSEYFAEIVHIRPN